MEVLKRYKYILLGVAVFAAAAYVYANYFSTPDVAPLVRGGAGGAVSVDDELLALLSSLQSIELDKEVFESPEFQSLNDFSRELILEPVGRPNPFETFEASAARNPR